jgi:hypothetical protein
VVHIVTTGLKRVNKDFKEAYVKVLAQNSPGETEKKHRIIRVLQWFTPI